MKLKIYKKLCCFDIATNILYIFIFSDTFSRITNKIISQATVYFYYQSVHKIKAPSNIWYAQFQMQTFEVFMPKLI